MRLRVALIFAASNANSASAAKAATTTIPIVFQNGSDPVKAGLVPSLNRPGGNITGVTTFSNELVPKRLEMLHELVPQTKMVGALMNPTNVNHADNMQSIQAAARKLGLEMTLLLASGESEVDLAFARAAEQHIRALFVFPDSSTLQSAAKGSIALPPCTPISSSSVRIGSSLPVFTGTLIEMWTDHRWHTGQKKVARPVCTMRRIVQPHPGVGQGLPARS